VPKLDWFHKYVATRVNEQDRVSGQPAKTTSYEYVGAPAWAYDDNELARPEYRSWGQFRGYARVKTRLGTSPGPVSLTESLFFRGMDGDRLASGGARDVSVVDSEGGSVEDLDEYAGMNRETLTYTVDGGQMVAASLSTPWRSPLGGSRARIGGLPPLTVYGVQQARLATRTLMPDSTWRRTAVEKAFDSRGTPTQSSELGDLAKSDDDRCSRLEYTPNATAHIITQPKRIEVVAKPCSVTPARPADVVSDTRLFYDGSTTHGTAPTAGNVTRVDELMEWPAQGSARFTTAARVVFDSYGRPIENYDVFGKKTTTAYTPAANGLVTQIVTTNPLAHVSTTIVDPGRGLETATVDANSRRTDVGYDPLGRLVKVWLAGRDKATQTPSAEFAYLVSTTAPNAVTTKTLSDDGTYRSTFEIYDGLARLRQTQMPSAGGGRLLTDVQYDARGLPWKANGSYFNDQVPSTGLFTVGDNLVPSQTVTTYDGMARPTAEIVNSYGVEKWRSSMAYSGDAVSVDPPTGGTATAAVSDALGRMVELRQYRGGAPTGAFDATRYTYDRFGRLSVVTDPAGNRWEYGHDLQGRVVRTVDPDSGVTTMTYDDGDRPVTTTDARNVTLATTYDDLGRVTSLRDGSVTGTVRSSWVYDTVAKGMATSSTRVQGGNSYTVGVVGYDPMYRPTGTRWTVPASEGALAGTYTLGASYTTTGQPRTTTYPAAGGLPAETVTYGYDGLGLPVSVRGLGASGEFLQNTLYSKYGQPLRHTFGGPGKEIYRSYFYDEATRRVSRVVTDKALAPTRVED
ncbi:MAG: RHS repeat protein, partial [Pseudonocardia sp.]|nr:RHS repeat protein [Pseudonocardia sp.]